MTGAGGTSKGVSCGHRRTRCRCSASGPAPCPPPLPGSGLGTAYVAACVLYGVCMLFPGVVDVVALFVGAFELYVSSISANSGAVGGQGSATVAVRPKDHNLTEGAQTPLWSGRQAGCDKGLHWRPLGPVATSRPGESTECTCILVG